MTALDAISTPQPEFSETEASRALAEDFGVQGTLDSLVSERDQNYRVKTATGERFVFKIANRSESTITTDFQIQALLHIERQGGAVAAPMIRRTLDGNESSILYDGDIPHVCRVVSYLAGTPLSEFTPTADLALDMGRCAANLDLALAYHLEPQLVGAERKLPPRQFDVLVRRCQMVKETLLGDDPPEKASVTVPGTGAKLVGGALTTEVTRNDVRRLLVDGFFPEVAVDERPALRTSGFQEFGQQNIGEAERVQVGQRVHHRLLQSHGLVPGSRFGDVVSPVFQVDPVRENEVGHHRGVVDEWREADHEEVGGLRDGVSEL